jgi:hypothetical protein
MLKALYQMTHAYCIESEILKNFYKKSRSGKKLIGLAKLSYLQDPMSDRNFFLSATLEYNKFSL